MSKVRVQRALGAASAVAVLQPVMHHHMALLQPSSCLLLLQVKLTSSDHQMFEVDEEVANQSHTVKNMIEGETAAVAPSTTRITPALRMHPCTLIPCTHAARSTPRYSHTLVLQTPARKR